VAVIEDPPAILLAVSADLGLHAGDTLKLLLAKHNGRGGGNARFAQGTVPSGELLAALVTEIG